jgi:hypothetical protein
MKLQCVLTATTADPLYMDFVPLFVQAWKKLYPTVDVKIILVHDRIPLELERYKDHLILFRPLPRVSNAFVSQYIRLLYPALLTQYDHGILITDVDMLPMSATYYTRSIENVAANAFVYYRDGCTAADEYAMCYNVATPKTWMEVFRIYGIQQLEERLDDLYSLLDHYELAGRGWFTDQMDLFKYVTQWNRTTGRFVALNDADTGFRRLCCSTVYESATDLEQLKSDVAAGTYSDCHCLRPYNEYKDWNDFLLMHLPTV